MPAGLVFISHVEEDAETAIAIAHRLEAQGYRSWYFERDSSPGLSYLIQVNRALEASAAVLVLVSNASVYSNQVTKEIVRAYEIGKPFIPIRLGISHAEFQRIQPEWNIAFGAASSILFTAADADTVVPRIRAGLDHLGVPSGTSSAPQIATLVSDSNTDQHRPQPSTAGNDDFAPELHRPILNTGIRFSRRAVLATVAAFAALLSGVTAGTFFWVPHRDASSEVPQDFATVLLKEEFRDNRNKWPLVTEAFRQFAMGDGRYHMSSSTIDGYTASVPVQIDPDADFQIRCRVTKMAGVSNYFFGLVWGKRNEDNYHDFAITDMGTVAVATKENGNFSDHHDVRVVEPSVNKGNATNVLVLRQENQIWRFYVNGTLVHSMPRRPFFGNEVGFMLYNNLDLAFQELVVTTRPR